MRRWIFWFAVICGFIGPAAASAKDIQIGVILPLSGRYADAGSSFLRGIRIIVDNINQNGGIKSMGGATINLVVADDASEAVKTSFEARRLMTEGKVAFILGPYSTPEAEAFMPVAARYKIGALGLQTTLTPINDYFTALGVSAAGFGRGFADVVHWLHDKGARVEPLVITYVNNDYGQTVGKTAQQSLEAMGIKVSEMIPVDPTIRDMTPIVLRVKADNPALVISNVYLADGVLLHRARFNLNYDAPVWVGGDSGFSDDRLWGLLGDEVASKVLPSVFALSLFNAEAENPAAKKISDQGHAKYPENKIDQNFMFGAQGATVLVEALEKAASDDPAAVNRAVRAVDLPAGSPKILLPVVTGDLKFDDKGVLSGAGPIFVQWKDGKKVTVFPEAVASAPPVLPVAH
jgi:ABC-type branched-subunit amino acid transport system substrate-binding protein